MTPPVDIKNLPPAERAPLEQWVAETTRSLSKLLSVPDPLETHEWAPYRVGRTECARCRHDKRHAIHRT